MVVSRCSAIVFSLVAALLCATSVAAAATNPFKKTKDYQFNDNIAWYFKDGAAIKSGSEQDGSDTLFYHLNISKNQLRLRLSKNDPSGELENTRSFDDLEIIELAVDSQRLKRFQWCLDNQSQIAPTLKQGSIVANGACGSAGSGDFVVALDEESRDRLTRSKTIEFVLAPYGRSIRLTYTLTGFAKGYSAIIAPPPPPPPASVVVETPKLEPKPAVAKTCYVEAPEDLRSTVQAIAYICDDKTKRATAEATIQTAVNAERKKRREAEAEHQRIEAERKKEDVVLKSVESDWDKKQTEMWVERCQKHWAKGTSPCYCAPYLDHAPAGVVNTCEK